MVQDTSGTMTVRHLVFKESLGYMALMPLRIFFEGRDDSPRHFDGKLNPFLLLFSVAGFLPLGTLPTKDTNGTTHMVRVQLYYLS